jgi:hypothetical protein
MSCCVALLFVVVSMLCLILADGALRAPAQALSSQVRCSLVISLFVSMLCRAAVCSCRWSVGSACTSIWNGLWRSLSVPMLCCPCFTAVPPAVCILQMERRERLRKHLAEREAAGEGALDGAPLIGQVRQGLGFVKQGYILRTRLNPGT